MNRCFFLFRNSWPRRIGLLCIWAGLALGLPPLACAQQTTTVRDFPASAQRASMVITQSPDLLINGQPDRLSPGARIRDTNNMLVLPATIAGNLYLVNYVREFSGMIREVWILTPDEAALILPTQQPSTFGAPAGSGY